MLFPAILTAKQKGSNQIILNDNRRGEMAGYVSKRIAHKKVFNVKKNIMMIFYDLFICVFLFEGNKLFFFYMSSLCKCMNEFLQEPHIAHKTQKGLLIL